jgi:hypothetical protein
MHARHETGKDPADVVDGRDQLVRLVELPVIHGHPC